MSKLRLGQLHTIMNNKSAKNNSGIFYQTQYPESMEYSVDDMTNDNIQIQDDNQSK